MRVIWVHTFNPTIKNSGVFMHEFLKAFETDQNIEIDLFYLGSVKKIGQLIKNLRFLYGKKNEYDIVHCQYGSFCSLACMFISKKKIVSLRGSDLFYLNSGSFLEKMHSRLARFFTRVSLSRYDKIIVMSKQMMSVLDPKHTSKTIVLTDPINLKKFKQEDKQYSRKLFYSNHLEENKLVLFTSISKNNPIKRSDMALNVIQRLNEISRNYNFDLITANDFSNEDMKYVFSAADVCLLTSLYEGFPNCIKESMACNTPFVSTDVSDLRDLSSKTKNCFVCNDSIDELAEKILLSLSLPRENLRVHVEYLSIENIKLSLIKFYETTLIEA